MAKVGFYVVQDSDPGSRLEVAVRLTDKAFAAGHRIFINAEDESQARMLDQLLWELRPTSFLPHGQYKQEFSDEIAIGWDCDPLDHSDLLINLQSGVAAFSDRFSRIAEIVTQEPASLVAQRESWRHYKKQGFELEKFDL